MHLYQFEDKLYLAQTIKPVTEHVAIYNQRPNYTIEQLPDDTLVLVNNKTYNLTELTQKYTAKAEQDGIAVDKKLSIFIRDGKKVTHKSPGHHQKITLSQSLPTFETITA